jgi:hypothetical protein
MRITRRMPPSVPRGRLAGGLRGKRWTPRPGLVIFSDLQRSRSDWRGLPIVHAAATGLGLSPLNLVVWAKTNAGMGSLYRSE